MTAKEYDISNPIFRDMINVYKRECLLNDISIDYCYNRLMYHFEVYSHCKNKIDLIKRLDFSNIYKARVLLNTKSISSKEEAINTAKCEFIKIKIELFSFLDSLDSPYFFILQPFYKFGSGVAYKKIPYQKEKCSGINNIGIAEDYMMYKLGGSLWSY